MSDEANGHLAERSYFCSECGRWLCATLEPLGVGGSLRVQCGETGCSRMNVLNTAKEPSPRPDRQAWMAERELQRRRARATTF